MPKKPKQKIAVLDIETDPFLFGRRPEPFALGFYDGESYKQFWGDCCIDQFVNWIEDHNETFTIYAHNGGKFDFYYLIEHVENPLKIVNGRILQCKFGRHTLRDSYAIVPVALKVFDKGEIDYRKFEREYRREHQNEISEYLERDCRSLFALVAAFRAEFGDKLTIGSTAIAELNKFHPIEKQTASHDAKFRRFYFGGRVQCFNSGTIRDDWKIYDVNSMYPHVMRDYEHPIGRDYEFTDDLSYCLRRGTAFFADITADSHGNFPVRAVDGSVAYPTGANRVLVTGHEIRSAMALSLLDVRFIHGIYLCNRSQSFAKFVDHYAERKARAKKAGDKASEIFSKLLLNSAYGKFGSNPDEFFDWHLYRPGEDIPEGFEPYLDYGWLMVMRREARNKFLGYFDVAVAASVTGAARAVLMRALAGSKRPVYCDTDSIICTALKAPTHPYRLGAWKLEAEGDTVHIAGKKLYSLTAKNMPVKIASKGVTLNSDEIIDIANGGTIMTSRDSPTFRKDGAVTFIQRKIRSTVK